MLSLDPIGVLGVVGVGYFIGVITACIAFYRPETRPTQQSDLWTRHLAWKNREELFEKIRRIGERSEN